MFLVALAFCAGCRSSALAPLEPCLSIATGAADDVSYVFGAALARLFSERAAGRCLTEQLTDGSTANVTALDAGSVDFGIARADTTYTAYVSGTPLVSRPHTGLRGVAIVYTSMLHVITRADTPVRAWARLRDTRVGMSIFSTTDLAPLVGYRALIAAAGDLGPATIDGVRMRYPELTQALAADQIVSALVLTAYPVPWLRDFAYDTPIRLLEIPPDAARRIRTRYPFFKPAVVPGGVYAGQDDPVKTIAVENLLVTREGVDEDIVYRVTRMLLENLPEMARDHDAVSQVNPDQAAATPIPLHRGAARYYRERELLR